jgi:hypothetical protein
MGHPDPLYYLPATYLVSVMASSKIVCKSVLQVRGSVGCIQDQVRDNVVPLDDVRSPCDEDSFAFFRVESHLSV